MRAYSRSVSDLWYIYRRDFLVYTRIYNGMQRGLHGPVDGSLAGASDACNAPTQVQVCRREVGFYMQMQGVRKYSGTKPVVSSADVT